MTLPSDLPVNATPDADLLRRAAAEMRRQHGPEHVRHVFWHRLADWLTSAAQDAEEIGLDFRAAAVARAYLGEPAVTA